MNPVESIRRNTRFSTMMVQPVRLRNKVGILFSISTNINTTVLGLKSMNIISEISGFFSIVSRFISRSSGCSIRIWFSLFRSSETRDEKGGRLRCTSHHHCELLFHFIILGWRLKFEKKFRIQSCGSHSARCFDVICHLDYIDANSAPVIDFRARIWNSTFVEVSRYCY